MKVSHSPGPNGTINNFYKIDDIIQRLTEVWPLQYRIEILGEGTHGEDAYVKIRLHFPTEAGFSFHDSYGEAKIFPKTGLGISYKVAASQALKQLVRFININCTDTFAEVSEEQKSTIKKLVVKLKGVEAVSEAQFDKLFAGLTFSSAQETIEDLQERVK